MPSTKHGETGTKGKNCHSPEDVSAYQTKSVSCFADGDPAASIECGCAHAQVKGDPDHDGVAQVSLCAPGTTVTRFTRQADSMDHDYTWQVASEHSGVAHFMYDQSPKAPIKWVDKDPFTNLQETNAVSGDVTSDMHLDTYADAYILDTCSHAESCNCANTHLILTLGFGGTLAGMVGWVTSSSLGGTDSLAVGHTTVKCGAITEVAHPYVLLHISEWVKQKAADSVWTAVCHSGFTCSYAANPMETQSVTHDMRLYDESITTTCCHTTWTVEYPVWEDDRQGSTMGESTGQAVSQITKLSVVMDVARETLAHWLSTVPDKLDTALAVEWTDMHEILTSLHEDRRITPAVKYLAMKLNTGTTRCLEDWSLDWTEETSVWVTEIMETTEAELQKKDTVGRVTFPVTENWVMLDMW